MTNEVKHFFTLLVSCVSSFVKCLFKYFSFFNKLGCSFFKLWSCRDSFIYSDARPLSEHVYEYFLVCALSIHFTNDVFGQAEYFNFDED